MQLTEQGEVVYKRTYSRTKPDGTKEAWPDTVRRVVDGNLALVDSKYHLPYERDELIRMMEEFKIIPAGRHLWMTGVPGRQYLFNCHVAGWHPDDIVEHFTFTFLRLAEGGGVGSNYSNHFLDRYPVIRGFNSADDPTFHVHIVCDPSHPDYDKLKDHGLLSQEYASEWSGAYQVEDTREGWAAAFRDLMETYYRPAKNQRRVFDVSRVRWQGARLMSSGGHASGPVPLAMLLLEVAEIMNSRIGHKLDGLSAMAIDHAIAKAVVAGGNRRSARMAQMHWSDDQIFEFIKAKQNPDPRSRDWSKTNPDGSPIPWADKPSEYPHWTTNISVEIDDDFIDIVRLEAASSRDYITHRVLEEIAAGMLTNGEPGFWNSSLSNFGEPNRVIATNPCLTGDTVIATVNGPRTFEELAEKGEDVEVYSWHPESKLPVIRWMRRPHKTAEQVPVLEIEFDSGLKVRATPDHGFYTFRGTRVDAKDLKVGQSVRAFSASRDSSGHERIHAWSSADNKAAHQWTHRMIYENAYGPIPDGMVVAHLDHNPHNNELANLEVMTPYEHASYDYPLRAEAGFNGHCPNHKVVAIRDAGLADVYNGMVEDSHTYIILDPEPVAGHMSGIVSANCGEIALEPWENCNLGHINLAAFVDPKTGQVDHWDLKLAHRLMTRFLMRATYGDVRDDKQRMVLDRNRRVGVGHLGVASYLALTGVKYSEAPENLRFISLLRELAKSVDSEAARYARELRIPVPVKTRTVAPTGTISKLVGVSEGIHPIMHKYFVRRIRFSANNPEEMKTVERYREMGYHVEPDLYSANTWVVSLPTKDVLLDQVAAIHGADKADELVQAAPDLTMTQMLAFQAMYQEVWADNAVSFTVNFHRDEYTVHDMVEVLTEFMPLLKGATVFPFSSMEQAPYEPITAEEYALYEDWLKTTADSTDENCATGACPVR